MGESFGGCLALRVAAAAPELVCRLVLVNPATCFRESLGGLSSLVAATNLLSIFPKPLYEVGDGNLDDKLVFICQSLSSRPPDFLCSLDALSSLVARQTCRSVFRSPCSRWADLSFTTSIFQKPSNLLLGEPGRSEQSCGSHQPAVQSLEPLYEAMNTG